MIQYFAWNLQQLHKKWCTVKSHNYESRNDDMYRMYNRIIDDAVMEVSIEKSHFNDKSHYMYYVGFSADQGLS